MEGRARQCRFHSHVGGHRQRAVAALKQPVNVQLVGGEMIGRRQARRIPGARMLLDYHFPMAGNGGKNRVHPGGIVAVKLRREVHENVQVGDNLQGEQQDRGVAPQERVQAADFGRVFLVFGSGLPRRAPFGDIFRAAREVGFR